MTYVKTNWQTGDIITAEKLNKIEDAIDSTIIVTGELLDDGTNYGRLYDITFNQLKEAMLNGNSVYFHVIPVGEFGTESISSILNVSWSGSGEYYNVTIGGNVSLTPIEYGNPDSKLFENLSD